MSNSAPYESKMSTASDHDQSQHHLQHSSSFLDSYLSSSYHAMDNDDDTDLTRSSIQGRGGAQVSSTERTRQQIEWQQKKLRELDQRAASSDALLTASSAAASASMSSSSHTSPLVSFTPSYLTPLALASAPSPPLHPSYANLNLQQRSMFSLPTGTNASSLNDSASTSTSRIYQHRSNIDLTMDDNTSRYVAIDSPRSSTSSRSADRPRASLTEPPPGMRSSDAAASVAHAAATIVPQSASSSSHSSVPPPLIHTPLNSAAATTIASPYSTHGLLRLSQSQRIPASSTAPPAQPERGVHFQQSFSSNNSTLDQSVPDDVLLAMLSRGQMHLSTASSSVATSPAIRPIIPPSLSQSTSQLDRRRYVHPTHIRPELERLSTHDSDRSEHIDPVANEAQRLIPGEVENMAARQVVRRHLAADQREINRLQRARDTELDDTEIRVLSSSRTRHPFVPPPTSATTLELEESKKHHAYSQANLLASFQAERTSLEQQHARALTRVQSDLEGARRDLISQQAHASTYSQQIESELSALRQEMNESHVTIKHQQDQLTQQRSLIDKLEQQANAQVIERQEWERELIQQSAHVLELKEAQFRESEQEQEKLIRQLSTQLESQTAARVDYEKRYETEEVNHRLAQKKIDEYERKASETDFIVREQRSLNNEVTSAYAQLEQQHHDTQSDLNSTRVKLDRTEHEYKQLELLYKQLTHESNERSTRLQQELTKVEDAYAQSQLGIDILTRDLKAATLDRQALQHKFIDLTRHQRMQKLFCHWIIRTQHRKYRGQEMCRLITTHERQAKQHALRAWMTNARLVTQQLKQEEQLEAYQHKVAIKFRKQRLQQAAFLLWRSVRVQTRIHQYHRAREATEMERGKKIELYHLLQRERNQWSDLKLTYEKQLLECELHHQRHEDNNQSAARRRTPTKSTNFTRPCSKSPARKSPVRCCSSASHQNLSASTPSSMMHMQRSLSAPIMPYPTIDLIQEKQDLHQRLNELHAHELAQSHQVQQSELQSLQSSIASERTRLAVLEQIRREREDEERSSLHDETCTSHSKRRRRSRSRTTSPTQKRSLSSSLKKKSTRKAVQFH